MAKIIKRTKKDGTCSYCIRVSNGYDRQGRQVLVNRTFTPPPGLTGKKLERNCNVRQMPLNKKCTVAFRWMRP